MAGQGLCQGVLLNVGEGGEEGGGSPQRHYPHPRLLQHFLLLFKNVVYIQYNRLILSVQVHVFSHKTFNLLNIQIIV